MNKKVVVTVICGTLLSLGALVMAQDTAPVVFDGYNGDVITYQDPDPSEVENMVNTEGTLETVTGDSASWYGQIVTLEGEIGDFINTRMFTLGEGAALDNDQVLVVNNSSYAFPPQIMEHTRIRLTGRLHPSLAAVQDGTPVDFGDLFGRDADNVNTVPDANTNADMNMADGFTGNFTMLDSSLSSYGFTVDGDHVNTVQELDRNLETLTEEQRTQLADALDQDAASNEEMYPAVSQAFHDAAAALRINDIETARTALQTAVTEIQAHTDMTMDATPVTAEEGGEMAPTTVPTVAADTTTDLSTPMTMNPIDMSRPNMVEWAYEGLIPDDLNNFTILEVFSIENVDFVEYGPGLVAIEG